MDEAREGRGLSLAAIAVVIERDLPVPRIAVEGEFEIAPPDFIVVDERLRFGRLHVIVEAVILGGEF